MKFHNTYLQNQPYKTLDGSEIRELMHPDQHGNKNQSLAEAIIKPNQTTALHKHKKTEEIYFITQGKGSMQLGNDSFSVKPGDSIFIQLDTAHCISNTGDEDLKILCCCSPAYSHADTFIIA